VFVSVSWDVKVNASGGDEAVGGGEDVEAGGLLPLEGFLFLFFFPIELALIYYSQRVLPN